MLNRITALLVARSPRERVLLAVLMVLVLPVALIFLVLLPLQIEARAAAADVEEARALSYWVAARKAEFDALGPPAQVDAPASEAIGISGVEQSLSDAGLRDEATRLGRDGAAGIKIGYDAVEFYRLANWLSRALPDAGYKITTFRFEAAGAAGLIRADLVLEPR